MYWGECLAHGMHWIHVCWINNPWSSRGKKKANIIPSEDSITTLICIIEDLNIFSSRGSSQPRVWTGVSCVAGGFFTSWAKGSPLHEKLSSNSSNCGEGNGTPLQYSCLENPMDGGAWKAAVHGVAEGRTWLSDFTFTFHFHALEKEMATHSSVLAWRIPGTAEPGGLPSMGSHRVGHDWHDLAAAAAAVATENASYIIHYTRSLC